MTRARSLIEVSYDDLMQAVSAPIVPAQIDWSGPNPRSLTYGDHYFGTDDGWREAQCVFIEGNRLIERFQALGPDEVFVIGETGFGTGLNLLLAAATFSEMAHAQARLQLVSVDLHPLTATDLARALSAWPHLKPGSDRLLEQYPPAAPGHHRITLSSQVDLTVMWGEASAMWQKSRASVDAWFLDGFSPATNEAMWSSALFEAIRDHSQPGATLASFTAAGFVRRGLEAVGFTIEKRPGFGSKRHRITGHRSGDRPIRRIRRGDAVIAGAGLAGATTARGLADRGWQVRVYDPNGPASGASGNLAGVVYATPSPHLQAQNRFYLTALINAQRWFRRHGFPHTPDQGQLNGVRLNWAQARRRENTRKAIETGAWPEALLQWLDEETACLIGAGYICPKSWIEHLLDHPHIEVQRQAWPIASEMVVDAVIWANAGAIIERPGLEGLPLKNIRGQVSECRATTASQAWAQAQCHAGYLTPAIHGRHAIGATYDLHHEHDGVVAADDQANLEQLKTHLPGHWNDLGGDHIEVLHSRAAYRCTSPDRLPLVGPIPTVDQAAWINVAHGSRGITHTPLCADLLTDLICQTDGLGGLSVDEAMASALDPSRYLPPQSQAKP